MKQFSMFALFACVGVVSGLAAVKASFLPKAPFNDPSDKARVMQIEERGLGEAIVAADMQKLDEIYAVFITADVLREFAAAY